MDRRAIVGLLAAFMLTRLVMVYYAEHPDSYPLSHATFAEDVDTVYHGAAQRIVHDGEDPYTDFDLAYPPGLVPFILLPERVWPDSGHYRTGFVMLMMLVDAAGFAGILLLASRWGSMAGPWLWVGLIALLGPVVYVRLDLVAAVATVWAIERASVARWFAAGGWLGYGAAAKLYPALLLPLAWMASPRRVRLLTGFLAVAVATVVVVLGLVGGTPAEAFNDSALGHLRRGIHFESTWGSILMVVGRFGLSLPEDYSFSTYHFVGGAASVLKPLALVLTLSAVVLGALVTRRPDEDNGSGLASAGFATLALVLGVGTVFSPQYVIWLVALAAVVMCERRPQVGRAAWLLLPIAVLTQYIYPGQYFRVIGRQIIGLIALVGRNLLVIAAGVTAFVAIIRRQGPSGRVPRVLRRIRRGAAAQESGYPSTTSV